MSLARAAALFALDPAGLGGLVARGRAGPGRDAFVAFALGLLPEGRPVRRAPTSISDDRLMGGIDIAATLRASRPVAVRGVLAEADGGVLVLPMAERQTPDVVARVAAALDLGAVIAPGGAADARQPTRFGVLALDESVEDERVAPALADRLALHVACDTFEAPDDPESVRARLATARGRLSDVHVDDDLVRELVEACAAFGIDSLRPAILAVRVARANAAFEGRDTANDEDARVAARLVLAPRACALPPAEPDEPAPPAEGEEGEDRPEPPEGRDADVDADVDADAAEAPSGPTRDVVLDAARAAIPPDLLARLIEGPLDRRKADPKGKGADGGRALQRGRPAGSRPGALRSGSRLALLDTLRAAAPRQALRRRAREDAEGGPPILVRAEDFRIRLHKPRTVVATIFVVDASGSAALHRLGEAKGAVLALLAQCYVRRDEVGLVAFRGKGAELLLAPTRSLTRVRRSLAQLPGGGGTPLAAGVALARQVALQTAQRGARPTLVFLTDGAANVALDGAGGRAQAEADVARAAAALKTHGYPSLLIDTSARPSPRARTLAERLAARYLPLPMADAARLAAAVRTQTR